MVDFVTHKKWGTQQPNYFFETTRLSKNEFGMLSAPSEGISEIKGLSIKCLSYDLWLDSSVVALLSCVA
jgi:hypothetical protein